MAVFAWCLIQNISIRNCPQAQVRCVCAGFAVAIGDETGIKVSYFLPGFFDAAASSYGRAASYWVPGALRRVEVDFPQYLCCAVL